MIQIERHAGKVAKVFEQGEEREEDRHGRQHDGNDPGKYAVHAEHERIVQPAWRTKPLEQERELILQGKQPFGKKCGRVICACECDEKDQRKQKQHHGDAGEPAGQQLVHPKPPQVGGGVCMGHAGAAGSFRFPKELFGVARRVVALQRPGLHMGQARCP